jgi:hypothetical protein
MQLDRAAQILVAAQISFVQGVAREQDRIERAPVTSQALRQFLQGQVEKFHPCRVRHLGEHRDVIVAGNARAGRQMRVCDV